MLSVLEANVRNEAEQTRVLRIDRPSKKDIVEGMRRDKNSIRIP